MQRLDPVDAAFLHLETSSMHTHVLGVMVLQPVAAALAIHPGGEFEAIRALLMERMDRLPGLRDRIVSPPLDLDHPYRVRDRDFNIDNHLHHVVVRAPGGRTELAALVGQIASRPLDRNLPLWELTVVSGLGNGMIAVVVKIHHAIADGITAVTMLSELLDYEPTVPDSMRRGRGVSETSEWIPHDDHTTDGGPPPPENNLLLTLAAMNAGEMVANLPTLLTNASAAIVSAAKASSGAGASAAPFSGPSAAFNGTLTPRRTVALGSLDLDMVRDLSAIAGCTINDALLASATLGLRSYLLDQGPLPSKPLVAGVPVSLHVDDPLQRSATGTAQGSDHGEPAEPDRTNRIATILARLPIQLADPNEVLQAVIADTRAAKAQRSDRLDGLLGDVLAASPPLLLSAGARLATRSGVAALLPPAQNLTVSNIPGPPIPLYLAGSRLVSCYPFGPLIEGSGLSITAMSNIDDLDLGIIACPDLVESPEAVLTAISEASRKLSKAVMERGPRSPQPRPW